MARPNEDLELALARWVVGALAPEDVPHLAAEALAKGCNALSVAILAGLRTPTSADIVDELPALLDELGVAVPAKREALKTHVDAMAHEIVVGTVTPYEGAHEIMGASQVHDPRDELWDQFAELYGLAVEYDELYRRPNSELDAEIIATAESFLSSGGLRIALD